MEHLPSQWGGTFAAVSGADGWYDYTVALGDVDTVGEVVFVVQDSSLCLPVFTRATVVEENVYVAWFAASAAAGTDLASVLTDTGTTLQAELDAIKAKTDNLTFDGTDLAANVTKWLDTTVNALSNGDVPANIKRVNGASGPAVILANWLNTGSHSGVASDGSTTTLIDAGVLTRADNAYKGGLLIIVGGTNQYFSATITSSDSGSATVTFAPAMPSAVDATTSYVIIPGLGHIDVAALETKIDTIDDFLDTEIAAITTAVITAAAGANIAADIIALKAETVLIVEDTGTTVPGLVNGLNDISTAQVNAEVDTALADIHLDHLLAVDYDPASKPGTATALLNEIVESDSGVSRFTVNALENGPTGSGASASAIADAVWDEAQSGHVAAGSFGILAAEIATIDGIVDTILIDTSTTLDGKLDTIDNFLDTEIAAILEDTGTTVPGLISALNNISTAQVNAEVDTALADIHLDHLLAVNYDPASKPGSATALLNEIVEDDSGVPRFTTNVLENVPYVNSPRPRRANIDVPPERIAAGKYAPISAVKLLRSCADIPFLLMTKLLVVQR